jgi:hypothetical protein
MEPNSCVVAGGSTEILNFVTEPIPPNANPLFFSSAIPSAAGLEKRRGETMTVCVMLAESVNETRQVLDTISSVGE